MDPPGHHERDGKGERENRRYDRARGPSSRASSSPRSAPVPLHHNNKYYAQFDSRDGEITREKRGIALSHMRNESSWARVVRGDSTNDYEGSDPPLDTIISSVLQLLQRYPAAKEILVEALLQSERGERESLAPAPLYYNNEEYNMDNRELPGLIMRQACIVPGCASNARTPAHIFPKNVNQRLLWLKKLKIENIEHVISLARCKLRVCYKHFSDDDYIYSANRRKLKDNAVPCLNIPSRIKCIAASNNIDSQQALISDCNLEFCPDIIALEPLQSAHENQDIRYATYIQEHDMNSNRSNEVMNSSIEVMNSNEVIEETLLSNAIMEHVQHTEGETRDKVTNFAYKRHERQDEVLATPNRRQQETNMQLRTAQQPSHRSIIQQIEQAHLSVCAERADQPFNTDYMFVARRYTVDEKILAISLLQRSPKCYSLIQNLYNMPSSKTLKRLLQKVVLKPGLCKIIIRYLHEKAKKMHNKDKYCLLIWDEIALTPHIQYDSKNDLITGFEDWGMRRTNKFADHALVFMLRGLYSGWKMPISFGYCDSQTKTPQLLRCIKQIITAVNKTELEIVATVCDQGSSNVAAINTLLKDTARKLWKQGTEHRMYSFISTKY
ncbi:hypothetical protein DBV15_11616 [Temnothorax longispinosus]|uniref:THAP-type domain-containing protein n=1 Tax=Temnothorax longispinosus TaxID=300112 RepID=A0A4S2JEP5_9HYME|nr:hypothetical protein DBV15_11616 [Temnothorax longispinosus]